MIDSSKYVVLDVETNGLTIDRDLLSVSIYMPDKNKKYERYLPLELDKRLDPEACKVNGITPDLIKGKKPFTQEEFDALVNEYELNKREILHFGRIDNTFIRHYLARHKIRGYNKLTFHDIKHHFITSSFSNGEYSKDNLCKGLGIEGVRKVHNGLNDCILEWKLFEKTNESYILCHNHGGGEIGMYELTEDYYIPVSKIRSFPNLKYAVDLPKVSMSIEKVYSIELSKKCDNKFDRWFQPVGYASERVLRAMLNAKNVDTSNFSRENFRKLRFIGKFSILPPDYEIPVIDNPDGTLTAVEEKDQAVIDEMNRVMARIREEILPLADYIKHDIFSSEEIWTQEEIINDDLHAFGYTDFSNEKVCLEMKFSDALMFECLRDNTRPTLGKHKYQFYVLSKGRPFYLLIGAFHEFAIFKISFNVGDEAVHKARVRNFNRVYKKKKVLQYTRSGVFVKEHESAMDAAVALGLSLKTIRDACNGRYPTAGGYQLKYKNSNKAIKNLNSIFINK